MIKEININCNMWLDENSFPPKLWMVNYDEDTHEVIDISIGKKTGEKISFIDPEKPWIGIIKK